MLTIPGPQSRFCDGMSRRSWLRLGALALGGLALPEILRAESKSGVRHQAKGTRTGLVVFAGSAQLVVAPTTDRKSLTRSIDDLSTGMGTAIGAAMLQGLAGQALPRPADTERSVDEALQLQIGVRGVERDLLDRQLARQDHACHAQRRGYLSLAARLRGAEIIDATRKPEAVRRDAVARTWRRLAGRTARG